MTERDVPADITLTADTTAALMADPDLADELERVEQEQGRAAMLDWLDARGLRWRAGGSDPAAAFRDAAAAGALEFGGPLFDSALSQDDGRRATQRRKAARKAQRKARRVGRGR